MKSNYEQSRGTMRSEIRSKRRKTNMVLNGLIGLVLLLIIIVSVSIFSKDDPEKEQQEQTVENKMNSNDNENETTKSAKQNQVTTKDDASNESENAADTEQDKGEDEPTITEGGGDNIQKTIVDPSWEPVGTTQSGPNADATVDWDERVKALASAINVDESNMTVWYLSRNGQDQAIGTVTAKDNPQQAYRVYLEWVNSEGWKPSKVEELIENDKGQ
ncbi:YrrS family protein [Bacillus sp. T3]|uniref:YrrS family protein n=1 Tax=Bacillus sp. T3 TaxID=467262 RepID=UPI00298113E9|nr:YrrS family protein [Bacillus sp. T3]